MSKRKPDKTSSGDNDRDFIEAVRAAEAKVAQQEIEVRHIQKRLREERQELRDRIGRLRSVAAELPLFDRPR